MAARLMAYRLVAALGTLQPDLTGLGRPTAEHGIEGAAMAGQQPVAVAGFEPGPVAPNDGSETHHHSRSRSTWSPLTSVFIE